MEPPSVENNGEHCNDVDNKALLPSTRDGAKAATEKFLVDMIAKADTHAGRCSSTPYDSYNDLFSDLSELWGLCAWHSRKLTRILELVRADDCSLEMVRSLEKPLRDAFDRVLGDDFLCSVEEYKFYEGTRLEKDPQHGGIDCDLIPWDRCSPRLVFQAIKRFLEPMSGDPIPPTVETLQAVEGSLLQWIQHVRSARINDGRFRKAMRIIMRPTRQDKPDDSEGDQVQMLLGASLEEFESLLYSMKTLICEMRGKLSIYGNITSGRHQLALTVLQDDILLELQQMPTQEQLCELRSPILVHQDQTPYQRAQALQVRAEKWVKHETEFCELRSEIYRWGEETKRRVDRHGVDGCSR